MATGYTVPPTSKLPFLNIITDVLFMHVPIGKKSMFIALLPQIIFKFVNHSK